jgi:hypothetical protein
MKKIIFLFVVALVCMIATAQNNPDSAALSKEQLADKKLSDKLDLAELKLEKVNQQIAVQDSIIKACDDSIKLIDEKIITTTNDQYNYTQNSNKELKTIEKKLSKANETEKKEIEKEHKAKQNEANKKIAEFDKLLKTLENKIKKFEATETKAEEKIKTINPNLKLAEEAVASAKKAIENSKKPKKK